MIKTIIGVDGMSCQMCEAHIQESIRNAFPEIKTVRANRKKNEAVVISDGVLDQTRARRAIESLGYKFLSYSYAPYESESFIVRLKGLFS